MKLNSKAVVYVPETANKGKTKYLAISAHQDDIEIMAYDGILKGFTEPDSAFYACVTTDGAGSARSGIYANYTDEEMKAVRVIEQKKAAIVGNYGGLYLLGYSSSEVKSKDNDSVIDDYVALLTELKPDVIYTHNLCDKHDTHIGVVTKVIKAVRRLKKADRPSKIYGCEVWRDLDWLSEEEKVSFDTSKHENMSAALLGVFDSQIAGGKRYDLATQGRRLANATYCASHAVDTISSLGYAMDLTPLIVDDSLSVIDFAISKINDFAEDVKGKISKVSK